MDLATVAGIVFGFAVIVWAMLLGGSIGVFWDLPSMAITIGGMFCSTLIHFSLPQVLSVFSVVKKTFLVKIPSRKDLIQRMVNLAAINRRDGALALEPEISKVNNAFFAKGLQLLVDGQQADTIRELLEAEIGHLEDRHSNGKKLLEYMGAAAPAFGMIGTLIGLVQMLKNLNSPDQIGAGMAVALITTFYGAFSANLLFIPLAGKLGIYSKEESVAMEMILEGVCAIAAGDNPIVVREKMQAFLSQGSREEVKAKV